MLPPPTRFPDNDTHMYLRASAKTLPAHYSFARSPFRKFLCGISSIDTDVARYTLYTKLPQSDQKGKWLLRGKMFLPFIILLTVTTITSNKAVNSVLVANPFAKTQILRPVNYLSLPVFLSCVNRKAVKFKFFYPFLYCSKRPVCQFVSKKER